MGYRNLSACIQDLERTGQLVRIEEEIDPNLEAADIHRRVYRAGGPAFLFARVRGPPSRWSPTSSAPSTGPASSSATRSTGSPARRAEDRPSRSPPPPVAVSRRPACRVAHAAEVRPLGPGAGAYHYLSRAAATASAGRSTAARSSRFPQVYTEHPDSPGWSKSNLGMYRVQLSGNEYEPDRECRSALPDSSRHRRSPRGGARARRAARGERRRRRAAGAGGRGRDAVAGRDARAGLRRCTGRTARFRCAGRPGNRAASHARRSRLRHLRLHRPDPDQTPKGRSATTSATTASTHDFPVHEGRARLPPPRRDLAIHGRRPPAAGRHDLRRVHPRTDRAGYSDGAPGRARGPRGRCGGRASACCWRSAPSGTFPTPRPAGRRNCSRSPTPSSGRGNCRWRSTCSSPRRRTHPTSIFTTSPAFFRHVLERFDPETDLHFQTRTTIDTLDYSAGMGLNAGSKLVIAAAGPKRRELAAELPTSLKLPDGFRDPRIVMPGVLAVCGPKFHDEDNRDDFTPISRKLIAPIWNSEPGTWNFPLITVVDDSEFAGQKPRQLALGDIHSLRPGQ